MPIFSNFPAFPDVDIHKFPIFYPAFVQGIIPSQNQEQSKHGAGIYADPVVPFLGPVAGVSHLFRFPIKCTHVSTFRQSYVVILNLTSIQHFFNVLQTMSNN